MVDKLNKAKNYIEKGLTVLAAAISPNFVPVLSAFKGLESYDEHQTNQFGAIQAHMDLKEKIPQPLAIDFEATLSATVDGNDLPELDFYKFLGEITTLQNLKQVMRQITILGAMFAAVKDNPEGLTALKSYAVGGFKDADMQKNAYWLMGKQSEMTHLGFADALAKGGDAMRRYGYRVNRPESGQMEAYTALQVFYLDSRNPKTAAEELDLFTDLIGQGAIQKSYFGGRIQDFTFNQLAAQLTQPENLNALEQNGQYGKYLPMLRGLQRAISPGTVGQTLLDPAAMTEIAHADRHNPFQENYLYQISLKQQEEAQNEANTLNWIWGWTGHVFKPRFVGKNTDI